MDSVSFLIACMLSIQIGNASGQFDISLLDLIKLDNDSGEKTLLEVNALVFASFGYKQNKHKFNLHLMLKGNGCFFTFLVGL